MSLLRSPVKQLKRNASFSCGILTGVLDNLAQFVSCEITARGVWTLELVIGREKVIRVLLD